MDQRRGPPAPEIALRKLLGLDRWVAVDKRDTVEALQPRSLSARARTDTADAADCVQRQPKRLAIFRSSSAVNSANSAISPSGLCGADADLRCTMGCRPSARTVGGSAACRAPSARTVIGSNAMKSHARDTGMLADTVMQHAVSHRLERHSHEAT